MGFLGIPPGDLNLECDLDGIVVFCNHSSAGVSTSIMVRDGSESVIMDAGDGTLRDLMIGARALIGQTFDDASRDEMGRMIEGIGMVALSHDHFDHAGGLYTLLSFLTMVGRRSSLRIMAPAGSRSVESTIELHRSAGSLFPIELSPLSGKGVSDIRGWTLEWIPADHREVTIEGEVGGHVPAFSYTLIRRGKRIFYTGDTAFSEGLVSSASGCDLAIAEATYPEGPSRPAHMNLAEARRVVAAAKKGWIVHLTGASHAELMRHRVRK